MWWYAALPLLLGCVQGRLRLDPLVDTNQGLIKGLRANDGDYSKFLGIPYAKVDENNPFGESIKYPVFETVFEAYDDSIACPQRAHQWGAYSSVGLVYSLDCLRLNVYVPNEASSRNKLPVLINIHGGGFSTGAGAVNPKHLVKNGVIVVSLNYRLGPYGFMCLDTPEVPGNQGLKDQYAALEWIRENIEAFGGDARKITVMGESAGGISIDFHLLSNRPKFFNKAIMQSGSALRPEEVVISDRSIPVRLAATLGFETEDLDESLKFLSKADPELVVAASAELSLYFRPCVEKEFENVQPFITEHPEHSDVSGTKNIAILSGYNSYEELHLFDKPEEDYQNLFHDYINGHFDFGDDSEMEDLVRQFYIGDDAISEDLIWELINFASDFQLAYPTQRSLVRYLENGAQTIYHYVFAYSGSRNQHPEDLNKTQGVASHGDELAYIFSLNDESELPTKEDQIAIERITTLWTNFVKYGNPTPETTNLLPVQWLPMTKDVLHYLYFDSDLKLASRPNHERTAFWDLFYTINEDKLRANL